MEKCKVFNQENEIINLVVINEQHKLLPQQETLIKKELGGEIKLNKIPADGLNKEQIETLAEELNNLSNTNIIVLSPIPLLLGRLAAKQGEVKAEKKFLGSKIKNRVFILHNDKRDKVEIGGTIRSVIAKEGWELIQL